MGAACSSAPKKPTPFTAPTPTESASPAPQVFGPPEAYGPAPNPNPAPAEAYGPSPVQYKPAVLVLGPGLARGFAIAGILRALHDNKIPIGAIVSTEMGSLMGALYVSTTTFNEFEFGLARFKPEMFFHTSGLLSDVFAGRANGEELGATLRQVLGEKQIRGTSILLKIAVHPVEKPSYLLLDTGPLVPAVRAALGDPVILKPSRWEKLFAESAVRFRPYPIAEARELAKKLGDGPVIVVDTLGSPATSAAETSKVERQVRLEMAQAQKQSRGELAGADLIIRPDLHDIGYLDFDKRTDAIFRGRSAAVAQMEKIRRLVGLPPAEGSTQP